MSSGGHAATSGYAGERRRYRVLSHLSVSVSVADRVLMLIVCYPPVVILGVHQSIEQC